MNLFLQCLAISSAVVVGGVLIKIRLSLAAGIRRHRQQLRAADRLLTPAQRQIDEMIATLERRTRTKDMSLLRRRV